MKTITRLSLAALITSVSLSAIAAAPFTVTVKDIAPNHPIPAAYALCKPTPDGKSAPSTNLRPTISWKHAPKETKSFAVMVSDPDVPADFSKAHKEGMVVGKDDARQLFYHWALIDIDPSKTSIPGSKSEAGAPFGTPALNDLAKYVPDAHNYGGACPPWNDERVHHYHYTVYALDTASLGLDSDATAHDVVAAITEGHHALAQSEVVGTYTLNKALRK